MTQFSKAHWEGDGDTIRMSMDFAKVNKAKRLVSGFATLDNVDTQGDIVTAEASRKAFSRARGNLREMHKKDSAVGKIVKFKEDEFTYEGKKYRGIFVTARISEGAQDTWLKVLDGTLSGFSIGGNVLDFEEDFTKDGNEKVRVIKDYDLTELSLVDNPANQLANVFTIHKAADGSVTVEGMAAETEILNVFYCEDDKIRQEKTDDSHECPVCSEKMVNIGWIEDGPTREEKVNNLVTKYLSPSDNAISKGGVEMPNKFTALLKSEPVKEDKNVSQEGGGNPADYVNDDQSTVADPTGPDDEVGSEDVNEVDSEQSVESDDVEEVHDEQEEISKKIDELKNVVTDSLEKTRDETRVQVEHLEEKITEITKSFETKASEFEAKFAELDENLKVTKGRLIGFEQKLEKMNSSDAFRKSADLDNDSAETVQKSDATWNGAFSVNNLLR